MADSLGSGTLGVIAGSSAVATLSMLPLSESLDILKLFGIFGSYGFATSLFCYLHIAFTKSEYISLKEALGKSLLAFCISSIGGLTTYYYTMDALPSVIISALSGFLGEKIVFIIPDLINNIFIKVFGISLSKNTLDKLTLSDDDKKNMQQTMLEYLDKPDFMKTFYSFLFLHLPSLEEKFTLDAETRNEKVSRMLKLIIIYVDRLDDKYLEVTLKPTACRHAKEYNVQSEDYLLFGIALIETLEYYGLKLNNFSRKVWLKRYESISDLMQSLGNDE